MLHWTLTVVADTPKTTEALIGSFLDRVAGASRYGTARAWLAGVRPHDTGPTELMAEISAALDGALDDLPKAILRGLAFCLAEVPRKENAFERPDRLPLFHAVRHKPERILRPQTLCVTLSNPGFWRSTSIGQSDAGWPMRALKVKRCSG